MSDLGLTTVSEAAKHFDCSRQTIYNAIEDGRLNAEQVGKLTVIRKDEKFEAFEVQEVGGRLQKRNRRD